MALQLQIMKDSGARALVEKESTTPEITALSRTRWSNRVRETEIQP